MGEMDRSTTEKIEKAFERFYASAASSAEELKDDLRGAAGDDYIGWLIKNMKADIRQTLTAFMNALIWEIRYNQEANK